MITILNFSKKVYGDDEKGGQRVGKSCVNHRSQCRH